VTDREKLAAILERMFDGAISVEQAEQEVMATKWSAERDKVLDHAYHHFMHYISDQDIREKDADYADMQTAALKDAIGKLRAAK
jgi:hypothetical protein